MSHLPNGWSYESINSIVEGGMIADGDWVESKDQDPNGKVRLTQLADVGDGEFRSRSDRWMNDEQASRLKVNYLQPGDLLMARMPDPLGRTCMVPENIGRAVTVVDVAIIRIARKDVNPKFVMWLLNSPSIRQQIEMLASGTTRRRITRKNLGTIDLPLPPFEEQNKIVELLEDHLSHLDAALADVKQVKIKAAQFRRSLLKAAYSGNLVSDGTCLMTSDTNVWPQSELRDLVEVLDKERIPVNSSERSKRIGDIPYYGATGQVGTIDKAIFDEELLILGEDGVQFLDPYKPKAYRISGPSWVNNHAHVLRPIRTRVNIYFLLHYLNQFNYAGFANGTTRLKLTQGAMNQIPVPLPPLAEQDKIVEIVEDHLSRLEASVALADEIEKQSVGLRRSLLQAAFTGKLTKEVASV